MTEETKQRSGSRFDLADGLLAVGVAAILAAIYLIAGGEWLLLAVGLLAVGVALRLAQRV